MFNLSIRYINLIRVVGEILGRYHNVWGVWAIVPPTSLTMPATSSGLYSCRVLYCLFWLCSLHRDEAKVDTLVVHSSLAAILPQSEILRNKYEGLQLFEVSLFFLNFIGTQHNNNEVLVNRSALYLYSVVIVFVVLTAIFTRSIKVLLPS